MGNERRAPLTSTNTFTTSRIGHRDWTAVEKYKLKGLADQRMPLQKIARVLKRSVCVTRSMASKLGIQLIEEAAST